MIYGDPCFWRPTATWPRLMVLDARILLFVFLAVFNPNPVTFFLLFFALGLFLFLGIHSVRLDSALRLVRMLLLGLTRPATFRPLRTPCSHIQDTLEGRWCPKRLRLIPWSRSLLPVFFVMVLIDPVSSPAEFHWQGLAPFHGANGKDSAIPSRQPPVHTPFYSRAPGNPDWRRECLLPGIGQPWCQQGLLHSTEPQPPLAGILSPHPLPVHWPVPSVPITDPDLPCLWIVRTGDSLAGIARDLYGDAGLWRDLASANGLIDPWIIHPGQCLVGTDE